MKKYIKASLICMFPFMIFGIGLPLFSILSSKGLEFSETRMLIYLSILVISVSVIITTLVLLLPYAERIDKLESETQAAKEKQRELDKLIEAYNKHLINQ